MSLIQWKRAANARQYGRHTSTCTWSCAEIQGDDSKCTGAWPLSSQKFSDARIFAFKIGHHPLVETLWGRHGNQWEYSTIWPDKTAVIWRASNSWQQFDHRCLILGPHSSADCLRPTTPLFSHTSKPIHTFAQQFNKQRVSYLSHELDKKMIFHWILQRFSHRDEHFSFQGDVVVLPTCFPTFSNSCNSTDRQSVNIPRSCAMAEMNLHVRYATAFFPTFDSLVWNFLE